MNDLNPRVIWLWRLQRAARFAVFWLPMTLIAAGSATGALGLTAGAALGAGMSSVGLTIALGWPRLAYAFWGYTIREHDLLIQQGVFSGQTHQLTI